jgi:diguanylate cyclase (GGDEF)-like protein
VDVRDRSRTALVRVARTGPIGWAGVAGAAIAVRGLTTSQQEFAGTPRIVSVLVFGSLFATGLVRVMIRDRSRRGPLAVLLAAILLWSAGGLAVAVIGVDGIPEFPVVAKVLVLLAYLSFTVFVLVDVGVGRQSSLAASMEALVVFAGTASLSTGVLLLPLPSTDLGGGAVLALLVPLLDVMLVMLVLSQVALRVRPSLRGALPLSIGFALFMIGDTHFVANLSAGSQTHGMFYTGVRIIGFALVAGSACRPAAQRIPHATRIGSIIFAAATAIAVAALAARPSGALAPYVVVPAVLTLAGAAGRLILALHEARRAVEALARSHIDDITGLPNRRALRARLDKSLAGGTNVALIVLDLDGFKDINDTLGHTAGDHVLEKVGTRIREAVPGAASVARLGGDEFGILAPRGTSLMMMDIAQDVLHTLSQPLHVDGIDVALSASVGIVDWYEDESVDSNELVRRAEVAMYRAKHARSGVSLYDPFHDDYSKTKLRISEELRRGIPNGELEVWYQPQIDASTLRPCALEALVRWRHPTDGLLGPVAFLPAARRAGLMPMLSQEVVRLAVQDVARWHAAGLRLRVAINCAPPELLSGVFVPRLHKAMSNANLPSNAIVLEVTEESFIAEPERAREILQEVRERGIQISIDDYGTGFSSLAYLRDLPVDELKLDRTFVSPIGSDARSRMIVASTVQMARALGMRTVAEGVEDAATAADLIAMGVGALQGYHISRPIPASEVVDWIVQWPTFADVRLTMDEAPRQSERPDPLINRD